MNIVKAMVFCFGFVGLAHAGPVDKKQISTETLADSVASSIVSDATALAKTERVATTQLKLVRRADAHRSQQVAYQGLTRQKMQLRTRGRRTATLIRAGYPQCVEADLQCRVKSTARIR